MSCNDESSTNTSNSRDNSQPISPSPTKRNQTNAINLGDGESSRNCSHDDNKPPKKKQGKQKRNTRLAKNMKSMTRSMNTLQ